MPLFGAKKDPKFDKTNDPLIRGYKEFGIDEKTKAMIYQNAAAIKTDKKEENPGIRWYLATVDEKGVFKEKDPKANKDYVYKLRAVKLERDNAGKFVKGKTSPKLVGKAHYIIEEEEVKPINFNFKYLDESGIYKDPSAPSKAEPGKEGAAAAPGPEGKPEGKPEGEAGKEGAATEGKGKPGAAAPGTEGKEKEGAAKTTPPPPEKKGGKTRRKKSLRKGKDKRVKRFTRKIKNTRIPKKTIGNVYKRHPPIKYQKVKH
jgi:hypothetical protein